MDDDSAQRFTEHGSSEPRSPDARDHQQVRPAFYAARSGALGDWWTLLHPPYTAWFLSYVVIGASLAPRVELSRLLDCLLAFFLAVGVAAHALDELHGRPLRTEISSPVLVGASILAVIGALILGVIGVGEVGWSLIPFMCLGPLVLVAYNLELLGGVFHNDVTFAVAWGAFPLLAAYVGETGRLGFAPIIASIAAASLSFAQRSLSTPARLIRRHATDVSGLVVFDDGHHVNLDQQVLLETPERALRATALAIVLFAAALAVARVS